MTDLILSIVALLLSIQCVWLNERVTALEARAKEGGVWITTTSSAS